jgi:hypothetical protein
MILFYRNPLSDYTIQHEYRKVALMLDQLNMRRLATSGESSGISEQVRALSHELSKQTGALFRNRLRPMKTMFEVNKIPRPERGEFDWPEPVGAISVNEENEQKVASWLVCPNPRMLSALESYLLMWAGASGALTDILKAPVDSLGAFIEKALDVAVEGHLAMINEGANPKSMKKIELAEAKMKKDKEVHLGRIQLVIPDGLKNKQLLSQGAEDNNHIERVHLLIFRAIVASVQNALQHSSETAAVNVSVSEAMESKVFTGIEVIVTNPLQSKSGSQNLPGVDGTRGVISSCLKLLDKDTSYPVCGKDKETWLTKLLIPHPARFKENLVDWIHY